MASDIVFAQKQGSAGAFTLVGSPSGTGAPADGVFWKNFTVVSQSPWNDVRYSGHSGADQKYMGGKPHVFQISGTVFASTEDKLWTEIDNFLKKNKSQDVWNVTGPIITAVGGAVILDINVGPHGSITALTSPFDMTIQNLGVD